MKVQCEKRCVIIYTKEKLHKDFDTVLILTKILYQCQYCTSLLSLQMH